MIVRPTDEHEKISVEDQKTYRSGMGMLLYLVKHSRPDIANVTRELSKANDGANPAAYKELLSVIKYSLKQKVLDLDSNPWRIPTNPGKLSVSAIVIMQETQ